MLGVPEDRKVQALPHYEARIQGYGKCFGTSGGPRQTWPTLPKLPVSKKALCRLLEWLKEENF